MASSMLPTAAPWSLNGYRTTMPASTKPAFLRSVYGTAYAKLPRTRIPVAMRTR